jgi:Tfp pilus assembly protein PilV
MKPTAPNDRGISLTEVLVAVLIFLTLVLGVGSSMLNARQTGDSSRQLAEATTLAVDKMEHLRTLQLSSADLSAGSHNDAANPLRSDGATGGTFTRTWTVTSDVPVAGMRRVQMTVSWTNRGRPGSVTLVSYLSLV